VLHGRSPGVTARVQHRVQQLVAVHGCTTQHNSDTCAPVALEQAHKLAVEMKTFHEILRDEAGGGAVVEAKEAVIDRLTAEAEVTTCPGLLAGVWVASSCRAEIEWTGRRR
jgi:hypothetical protein